MSASPAKGKKRGPKPMNPTPDQRQRVLDLAGVGANHQFIADDIGIDKKTLYVHFRRELDAGMERVHHEVASALVKQCLNGNPTAIIWYEKTRRGYRDLSRHELTGGDGGPITTFDLSTLSPDERKALLPVIDKLITAAESGDEATGEDR